MATNALSFLLRLLAGAAPGGCGCGCGCRHTDQDVEIRVAFSQRLLARFCIVSVPGGDVTTAKMGVSV
ncbi:hypothetical protein OsI_33715 [Oryza sativa Indica Group]|uniref:Secreted protein n=2 Tax=Oryza TaxID=4527 RepID=A0A0E0FI48_ORYNI|nr:hypothetical protein OsI_33715 [Oryza sativa Indica Group]